MTLEKLRLTLNPGEADELQYDLYPIQEVDINSRKEAFSIAPPGLSAAENILLGVSGMQADISVRATLWDDGSDRANGTYSSTVTTVDEQATFLEDEIHAPDFGASWELDHLTGAAFNDDEVFVESIEPTVISQQSPKWKPVRISLRRGGSV
ncbi:hypothetical protein HSTV1_26 [Haloarcula sinaiiensis tailed virus 1]|uniref:Uncharacterized protein n=1 Tax=Haloarcula sinaiiensis tailed virus 1 TaxID=1262530 RepID=R9QSS7_9CAUD|nr:hypothetical protein HSTV1_26 [Haloarcula sinaiiensis tailed virus 1]AGC34571.1 hypothetical protein HSTV1_26 [Haloarcula sinaiiensis tailed virus 1]